MRPGTSPPVLSSPRLPKSLLPGSRGCERNSVLLGKVGKSAFSLVEVVIALGIASFVLVPLMGLMSVGIDAFRSANDTSIMTQINQRIVSELQQTDFSRLITDKSDNPIPAGSAGLKDSRYFDDQGNEIVAASRPDGAIYEVNTRIAPEPALPGTSNNPNLATVTVQVAKNPEGASLTASPATLLWPSSGAAPVATFSTLIARNK